MPARATTKATAKAITKTAPAKAAPVEFAEPEQRIVGGQVVVKSEPDVSPLSAAGKPVLYRGRNVLTLADGSTTNGCADCDFTGTRGEVTKHRIDEHGAGKARRRAKTADDVPAANVMAMTIGEVLTLAGRIDEWEGVITALTADRDDWKAKALSDGAELRSIHRALAKVGFKLSLES